VSPDTVATLLVGTVIGIVTQAFFEPGAAATFVARLSNAPGS